MGGGVGAPEGTTTVFVSRLLELQVYERISDPGIGHHPPWVALAHAGSMVE